MKATNMYLMGLITATLLVGCGGGTSTSTNADQKANDGSSLQCKQVTQVMSELNKQYASSKDSDDRYSLDAKLYKSSKGSGGGDSSKGSGGGGGHNEGRACLSCHSFTSAGTVFSSLTAGNNTPGAAGYSIRLNDNVVYRRASYGVGNQIASSFPTGNYTAYVIDANGNIVNSSANMSHDASRRNCNSCHSSTGNSGAPGRITNARLSAATPTGATTSACVSFNNNVMPILEAKCKSCHGSNGNFTITTANATYTNISSLKSTIAGGAQYLLDKGTNTQGHGGGKVISTTSGEYTTIKAWISEGALNN